MLLETKGLSAYYGRVQAIRDVSLKVERGDWCVLIGENGSGKSTTLKCMFGLIRPKAGKILLNDHDVTGVPPWKHLTGRISGIRVGMALQGRRLFASLTVAENLAAGAYVLRNKSVEHGNREWVLAVFPWMAKRLHVRAGVLSGGEQQQLAMGRTLMTRPDLLLLDEPTLGLSPEVRRQVLDTIGELRRNGMTVIMVEQNVPDALAYVNRCFRFQSGTTPQEVSLTEVRKSVGALEIHGRP